MCYCNTGTGTKRATVRLLGSFVASCMLLPASSLLFAEEEPPVEWVEPETGHRVVRLSKEPGSKSLYFHQYPFSADGKKMVFSTPNGISAVNLETREVESVVEGRVRMLVTGRKTGDIYFLEQGEVKAADLDTHEVRTVASLPEKYRRANIAPNADETLLVGKSVDPDREAQPRSLPSHRFSGGLARRWASGTPMVLFTIDVETGQLNVIHRSHDWLNHLQCSPTDPHQIMFCHEGPWHYVDRIWLIRTDGTGLTKVHPRTIDMEIFGHEFFSNDGKTVWYDLQTPRSLVFWLAGYHIETGKRTWYHLERNEWSVHYNISPDGRLFSGDGGGPDSVANRSPNFEPLDPPGNGQWMYFFRPKLVEPTGLPAEAADHVKIGMLESERLVDLSNHNYDLEPNGIFTPDGKWLVFRSNMHGPSHVYAVEVECRH